MLLFKGLLDHLLFLISLVLLNDDLVLSLLFHVCARLPLPGLNFNTSALDSGILHGELGGGVLLELESALLLPDAVLFLLS